MGNKQHNDDHTFQMTKRIRISLLVKRNETFIKKKRNEPRYNLERIGTKIIFFNIYEIEETIIYKELSRRFVS